MPDPAVPLVPGHSEPLTHICETCGLVVGDDSKHTHDPGSDDAPDGSDPAILRP